MYQNVYKSDRSQGSVWPNTLDIRSLLFYFYPPGLAYRGDPLADVDAQLHKRYYAVPKTLKKGRQSKPFLNILTSSKRITYWNDFFSQTQYITN